MQDNEGNRLYRVRDNIYLHLNSEPHPRLIGLIDEANNCLHVRRDSSKHLFIKGNAYGFNETILRTATKFDKVKLCIDKTNNYMIPVSVILEQGEYLNFKSQGFELQLFLKVPTIETYKILS